MQIAIQNTVNGQSEVVHKNVTAGRTVLRISAGDRIEIVDPVTGRVPHGLKARRGGADGNDLIIESADEAVQIEGFFVMAADGQGAVAVVLPGGEIAEISPDAPEFAVGSALVEDQWAGSSFAAMQPGQGGSAGGSGSGPSVGGGGVAAGGAKLGAGAWAGIGIGGAAAAAAVADDDDDDAPAPTFSLSSSVAAVDENGTVIFTLTTKNVAPGTQYDYTITGVSAADVVGGALTGTVTIGADGKATVAVTLVGDALTEGAESLKLSVADQTASVTVNDTSTTPVPTFDLTSNLEAVNEGQTVTFTLSTTNVAAGTQYQYTIDGVSADDVVGGALTGTVTIDANGQAVVAVTLRADALTEGAESLKLTVAGEEASVTVNDTSTTPVPTFDLTADRAAVDEGQTVTFTLSTTHVAAGTQFNYTITGVSAADVAGGALSGIATIDANGNAVIPVTLLADSTTEYPETLTLTVTVPGQDEPLSVAVPVNDTSTTPAFVLTAATDDLQGTDFDDVFVGASGTYTGGDMLDGGDGDDKLNLTLSGGTDADGVTVKNIEEVNLHATAGSGGVALHMSDYDGSVQRINIHDAKADVEILDQQSIADVRITDTVKNVTLDYDSQVVVGENDALNLTIDEVGDAENTSEITVDDGIETLNVVVDDGKNESSNVKLIAQGATAITLSSGDVEGREEQRLTIGLDVNEGSAAGATFDAREFAGEALSLYGINGGNVKFAYTFELSKELEEGETATVTINGREFSVTNLSPVAASAEVVADQLVYMIQSAGLLDNLSDSGNVAGSEGSRIVTLTGFDAPATIEVVVAGEPVEVLESNQEPLVHSSVSTVLLSEADDLVQMIGSITVEDRYELGGGDDSLHVTGGSVYGTVAFGDGAGLLNVSDNIGGEADVSFGAGDSAVVVGVSIGGRASVAFGVGENSLTVGEDVQDDASIVFAGGASSVEIEGSLTGNASIVFGDEEAPADDAPVLFMSVDHTVENGDDTLRVHHISGNASVVFGGGNDELEMTGGIGDNASVVFGSGNNLLESEYIRGSAEVIFGDGDNQLYVGTVGEDASVVFGQGDNLADIGLVMGNASVVFGQGDNLADIGLVMGNASLVFGGNATIDLDRVSGGEDGVTITVAGNADLDVSDEVIGATITVGGTADIDIGGDVIGSTISFAGENSTLSIGGTVGGGSNVTFGDNDDSLSLTSSIFGEDQQTVIDMAGGDDQVTITDAYDDLDVAVGSGGLLKGGEGNDKLTVAAIGDIDVVARTQVQSVLVTLEGPFQVGDVVSLTIGEDTFEYEVAAQDIVQGDGTATAENVAEGLMAAIDDAKEPVALDADQDGATITLTGKPGEADVNVEAEGATVTVLQITDAGVSGFETLELVALNGEAACSTTEIRADFALIDGVEQVNLVSEVQRVDQAGEDSLYSTFEGRDAVTFTLENLPSSLSNAINISGYEASAEGNVQVERITINDAQGAHHIGDVITVTIGEDEYSYTVTASDLADGDEVSDANNIAAGLAAVLAEAEIGFTVHVDDNQITLVGSPGEDVGVSVRVEREVEIDDEVEVQDVTDTVGDGVCNVQHASPADDHEIDTYVNAVLAADEDGDDDTLELTINGKGNFDIGIRGVGEGDEAPFYENLVLKVQDEHSHYIDTDTAEDCEDLDADKAFRKSLRLLGGVAGASIVLADVMAKTVDASDTEANITVGFDEHADDYGEGTSKYEFTVTTSSGDDLVDMSGVVLSRLSTIDLGDGTDRLKITNGRHEADAALGGSSDADRDRMFKNVSGVEELEVSIGEDEIALDDDAYAAGFEKVVVNSCSNLSLYVGDEFKRDLSVEIGDKVDLHMEVYNDNAITVTAGDKLDAEILTDVEASAALDITAGDRASIGIKSHGSGDLTIVGEDCAVIAIEQFGAGSIAVTADSKADVDIVLGEDATGDVAVTVGRKSEVSVDVGELNDTTADLSITQTDSDKNVIELFGLNDEQGVTVDITAYGAGEHTSIADFGYGECGGEDAITQCYDTNLIVRDSEGGIDTLIVRSNEDYGPARSVGVAVADSWAVGNGEDWVLGEGEALELDVDFTVDVSAVETAGEEAYVLVNASLEHDANLDIIGSKTSTNILLGGGQSDRLTGGNGFDVLQGDAPGMIKSYHVDFDAVDYAEVTLTIEGLTLTAAIGGDPVSGEQLATAFESFLLYGEDVDGWTDGIFVSTAGELGSLEGVVSGVSREEDTLTITGAVASDFTVEVNGEDVTDSTTALAAYETTTVTFDGTFEGEDTVTLTVNGHSVTAELGMAASFTGAELADAFFAYFTGGEGTDGLTFSGDAADILALLADGRVDGDGVLTLIGRLGVDLTVTSGGESSNGTVTVGDEVVKVVGIASDVLEGGEGTDFYVIAQSGFETMDTIVGLDLGGYQDGDVDKLALGTFIPGGDFSDLSQDFTDLVGFGSLLQIESVVNAGVATDLVSAVNLELAVQTLFEGSGAFDTDGDNATNSAGLFNYGGETYLIAVGEHAEGFFGDDDFIVKVTGFTGVLDTTDFISLSGPG